MPELYEVLLVDGDTTWHAGFVVDDETETDVLLAQGGSTLLFASRAGLEHTAQQNGLELSDDDPDEVDLDLGGWLTTGAPEPTVDEVSQLWHLLYDDPVVGRALGGEELGEAYDDLVGEEPDWFTTHGPAARAGLAAAVTRLRLAARKV